MTAPSIDLRCGRWQDVLADVTECDALICDRFWSRAMPEPNSGCWLWMSATDKDGYGKFQITNKRRGPKQIHVKAHRFALALTIGRMPMGNVLHGCHNPCCVNPDHLREGSQRDNIADMDRAGRRGRRVPSAQRLRASPLEAPMMPAIDLRLGDYRDVLRDVESVDCLIADPPYSERTHAGQRHGRRDERRANGYVSARGIGYAAWSAEDATAFVDFWAPRVSGWFCVFSDHALASAYEQALVKHGRTWFAPIACVQIGMNVRLAGDGPSNWTTWLTVARPKALAKWGTLPGAYVGKPWEDGQNSATAGRRSGVVGSKPVWLMRALVRDYSRPGDLVVDPCAGGATTLIASQLEGRRSIGAEMDPDTFAKAERRIKYGSHAVADNGQERLW